MLIMMLGNTQLAPEQIQVEAISGLILRTAAIVISRHALYWFLHLGFLHPLTHQGPPPLRRSCPGPCWL